MSVETVSLPKPMGRPARYSKELAEQVCLHIAQGLSIRQICAIEGMPSHPTIYKWLYEEKDFISLYAHAREAQSEFYAQEMLDLVDECGLTHEQINKVKLQIDTRKWIAAKLKPRKYGDSTIIRGDKDNPIEIALGSTLDALSSKRGKYPLIEAEVVQDAIPPAIEQKSPEKS